VAVIREGKAIPVWDRLVRFLHWATVALVGIAFTLDVRAVHELSGKIVLGLVLLRVIWGFAGTNHARFTDFVARPASVLAYLRALRGGRAPRYMGHNPAGGAMVVLLLATLIITAGSGWLSQTDRFFGAPWVSDLHSASSSLLLVLIGAHVLGVIASSVLHRENLVRAMWTGRKPAVIPGHEVQHERGTSAGAIFYPHGAAMGGSDAGHDR
jgi:cytochrome b